ncbi:dihydrodipicolinate synthase family protein [Alsobacter sp. SYSU BS001988]
MSSVFQGLSAFPITPADRNGRVDAEALGRLVERLIAARVDSIGLLGSTGTYAYLSREERRRAVSIAAEAARGRTPLVVGIGALRTDEAIRLGRDAREAGADAVLLAPMSYTPLTEREVEVHFTAVADAVGLPLCVYDNPATTHFSFTPALIGRLSRHPSIVAVKAPSAEAAAMPERLAALRAAASEDFQIGFSGDWNAAEALIAGGAAWYSVLGGLFPEPCMSIVRAAQAGDVTAARDANAALEPLWALFRELSSLRVVYAAANLLGLCRADPPLPILPLAESNAQRCQDIVSRLGLR